MKGINSVLPFKENMKKASGNILVVGEDRNSCNQLIESLSPEGFQVDLTFDGETGIRMALNRSYSLIILDIMRPEGDNDFSLLQRIRSGKSTPILVMSAREDGRDLIAGLEMGADNILQKPFNPQELIARIRALLRRISGEREYGIPPHDPKRVRVGDVEMDTGSRVVFCAGNRITLTSVEFRILEILLCKAGQFVSREELMRTGLGRSLSAYDRSIDVHVSNLRKKLGHEVSRRGRIKTIRGVGYLYAFPSPADINPII
jgi:two-component system, OmpR family, response regulator CpxR